MIESSPLTVLSDSEIRQLLEDLTPAELDDFRHDLAGALHDYSTNKQAVEDGSYDQPTRISTSSPATGATTLYMPSSSPAGIGVKIVTATPPGPASAAARRPIPPTGVVALLGPDGSATGFLNATTLTGFRTALASTCLVAKRGRVQTLTVFGAGMQAYWHVRLALKLRGSTVRDVYIINRSFSDRARSVLKSFHAIPAATRQAEGWAKARFSLLTPGYNDYGRLVAEHVRAADVVFCCTPSTEDLFPADILTSHGGRRRGRLIAAVGSYRPSMREVPADLLAQALRHHGGRRHFHRHAEEGGVIVVDTLAGCLKEAGEIVQAGIGSHQLVELGELVMLHRMVAEESDGDGDAATSTTTTTPPTPTTSTPTPATPTTPATPASRSLSFDLGPRDLRRSSTGDQSSAGSSSASSQSFFAAPVAAVRRRLSLHHHHRKSGSISGGVDETAERKRSEEDMMARWLRDGNVIYKSVGFGLMDLVVGTSIINFARLKGVGTTLPGFNEP